MNRIGFFMVDLDDVSSDVVVSDMIHVTHTLKSDGHDKHQIHVVPTDSDDSWHLLVVLDDDIEFDRALEIVEGTHADRKYVRKVKERGMFFEKIGVLKECGVL